ncbi:MAG: cyclopropane-fatty-acyl-phospholipid synthase family protein [Gemmatimonadota bacterium]|nr:cyclopropane-fatty-acyl-phospholipid synthase family protein [Gemmatimonadota bacterium]
MSQPQTLDVDDVTTRPAAEDRAVRLTRAILADLFGPPARRAFAVRLWNGVTEAPAPPIRPRFTLVLRDSGSLRRMLLPPSELGIVESYIRGDIDVEGDLEAGAGIADIVSGRLRSPRSVARLLRHLLALPSGGVRRPPAARQGRARELGRLHSKGRDAAVIRFHYDVSNEFYALWLDRRMLYSCAYFRTGAESLDAAQVAKLDHICRKLRLAPGERLLDIGCGWGALVIHAAEHYGVHAHGVTLSEAQGALARERIAAAGLQDRCLVEVRDYRDLPRGATYDKVSSVGVVEHIGRPQLATYFATAYRLTRPGGIFLNHCLINNGRTPPLTPLRWAADRLWRRGEFIDRYVFPDSKLLPVAEIIAAAERAGLEARDVENLRDHYALTTRHWVRRLESRHAEVAALVGEAGYRVWRLYMAAGARMQATGRNGIVQIIFARPEHDGRTPLPLTRADLYTSDARGEATG